MTVGKPNVAALTPGTVDLSCPEAASAGTSAGFAEHCLGYAARRAARSSTAYFNAALKPFDLNLAQFGLLAAIHKRPGKSLSAIAELLTLDDSTLTRALSVLNKRELVEVKGGRGRAGKQVWLSADGEALLERAYEAWADASTRLNQTLSQEAAQAGLLFMRALEAAASELLSEDGNEPSGE